MSDTITLPSPDEIARRIRACREELAALKKLERMAKATHAAGEARERRSKPVARTAGKGISNGG